MDEIINLKAKTFDIIMAKTRLVEELNALDRVIDQNVREIQGLERQKISSERQIEVPSSEVLNQDIEEESDIISPEINSQPTPNQISTQPEPIETNNKGVILIPVSQEEINFKKKTKKS